MGSIIGLDPTEDFSYGKDNIRHKRDSPYNLIVNGINPSGGRRSISVFHFDASEYALYEGVYIGDEPSPKALVHSYKYRFDTGGRH